MLLERVGLECGGAIEPERVPPCHSGFMASMQTCAMNVAKASLSQRPFHQRMVTRSPNHMCASSWATTFGDTMLLGLRRGRRIDEEQRLAERDQTEVLHRAGGEVGHADEVELVGRVGDAEVVGEEARGKGPALHGEARERLLPGWCTIRSGTPSTSIGSVSSSSPTMKATR